MLVVSCHVIRSWLSSFRRRGHNEMDDPTLTQPLMYKAIHGHEGVSKAWMMRRLEI